MKIDLEEEFRKLVTNDEFIRWVENPTPETDKYWQSFLVEHPTLKNEFSKAKYFIQKLKKEHKKIDEEQIKELWSHIQSEIDIPSEKVRTLSRWVAAASLILLVGLGSLVWYWEQDKNSDIDYRSIAEVRDKGSDVQLVFSNHSRNSIRSRNPSISYTSQGKIYVDSISVKQTPELRQEAAEKNYNQLIVPYGKLSTLTLSDGTVIYLNSGSQVIYPVSFSKEKREIYISGEAYLKVSHHAEWPFIVTTDHLKVKVLGTEFDVKSYPEESSSSVVLVSGKVQALAQTQKILMNENERVVVNNGTGETTTEKVDVEEDISWKDGWLDCRNEKLGGIAAKLNRYYNVDIQFDDQKTEKVSISGKLDLRLDCDQVLDAICFTASVKYEKNNGKIVISMNE